MLKHINRIGIFILFMACTGLTSNAEIINNKNELYDISLKIRGYNQQNNFTGDIQIGVSHHSAIFSRIDDDRVKKVKFISTFNVKIGCPIVIIWTSDAQKSNKSVSFVEFPFSLYELIASNPHYEITGDCSKFTALCELQISHDVNQQLIANVRYWNVKYRKGKVLEILVSKNNVYAETGGNF